MIADHSCRRFDSLNKRLRRVERKTNAPEPDAPELVDIEVVEQRMIAVEQRVVQLVTDYEAADQVLDHDR